MTHTVTLEVGSATRQYYESAPRQRWESSLQVAHPFQAEVGYRDVCKENSSDRG